MSCPSEGRLAAAASGEDAGAAAHATSCLRCARVVADQRAARAFVAHAPVAPLAEPERAELVAEILARADAAPARRSVWSAGIVAVAAAITAFVMVRHDGSPGLAPVEPEPVHPVTATHVARTQVPPTPVTPTIEVPAPEPPAPVERTQPPRRPVPVPRPKVERPPPPVDPAATSVAAFRSGWEALGAGRNTDAILAFDRATDPVVAEDAAFWAAVAAQRAGDHAAATRRFQEFLSRFPQSPHGDAARAALAK